MSKHAKGTFEVKLIPHSDEGADPALARMTLDKEFSGDLNGTSKGQMLAAATTVPESAGYVAMERVHAILNGRQGTFALQHSGTMNRGKPQLTITVVPDSGTEQLTGLEGQLTIDIVDGKHLYDFEYDLPE